MQLPEIPNNVFRTREAALSSPLGDFELRENVPYGYFYNSLYTQLNYDASLYQNSQDFSARFRQHLHHVAEQVCKIADRDARVLEIGCGKAAFVDILGELGFENVYGFDTAYEGANPRIESRYFDEQDQDFGADVIILRHTLEHIPDPVSFLQHVVAINGNPSATLVIEVPCFEWTIEHGAYWDLTIEHCNYFTEASFRKIFTDDVDVSHVFSEQYLLVIAKARSLAMDTNSSSVESDIQSQLFSDGYPSKSLQQSEIDLPITGRYWVWGCATKGVCFLFHRSRLEPGASAPLGCIDMNPFKQGRYLSGLGYQVQTPEYLYEHAQSGDLVIVSNSTYQAEIEALLSSHVEGSLKVVSL